MDAAAAGDLETRIRQRIAMQLKRPVEQVADQTSLTADLGVDSLDHVSLIMDLERHFGITIPDDVAVRCVVIRDLVDAVHASVAPGGP